MGCGAGLIGIQLLKQGVKGCVFQDYNEEVLSLWTIPNLGLNLEEGFKSRCGFVYGDWRDFEDRNLVNKGKESYHIKELEFREEKYDLIVMSDVLYQVENYETILDLIADTMSEEGRAVICTKSYYYGNGGSLGEFKEFVLNIAS